MQLVSVGARLSVMRADASGASGSGASASANGSPASFLSTATGTFSTASSGASSASPSISSTISNGTAQGTVTSSAAEFAVLTSGSPPPSTPSTPPYSTGSLPSNSTITPASSSGPALSSSTGRGVPSRTIIGASVGGGAFLLILAAILVLSLRRRSRRQRVAPSSEFLHPVAQEQFRYARSAHTMSMDSGLLSSSMEKFPASPPLPSMSPHMESFFGQAAAASPSTSRQSTLSSGSPQPAMYSHRARASSAGSVALSSLYVLADNGLRGGGSPLMQGFDFETPQQTYTRATHGPESSSPFIVPEEPHDIGVAR